MRLTSVASTPVRVFLFKSPFVDAFHLRLAIGMSLMWCDVQVLERSDRGVRTACAIARSGQPLPGLVLVDDEGGGDAGSFESRIRRSELGDLPLAVLGDGEDPGAERHALRDGADGFIPLPTRPPSSRGPAATSRGSGRTTSLATIASRPVGRLTARRPPETSADG